MNSRSLLQPYIRYGDPARTNESNRSCFARIEPYWEDCLISITENLTLPQQKISETYSKRSELSNLDLAFKKGN